MSWRQGAAALLIMASGVGVGVQLQAEYELVDSVEDRSAEAASSDTTSAPDGRDGSNRRDRKARPKPWRFKLRHAARRLPVEVEFAQRPTAGILFDVETGEVLWQRHPHRRLPIASLTKILTALIVVERHRPGERVRITRDALAYEGSGMGVLPKKGKRVRLESLLNGLLLVSGNDAAIALAQHDAGSVGDFVKRMNRVARRRGLRCSRFSSPHGLADDGRSCARDLAALARAVLAERRIRRIVGSNLARFPFPVEGGYLDLYNNNPFIRMGMEGITGVKTGYTDVAGRCYVITRKRGGRHLGVVLLHAPNPLEQVPALLRAGVRQPRSAGRQMEAGSRERRRSAKGSRPSQVPLDATGRKRAKK